MREAQRGHAGLLGTPRDEEARWECRGRAHFPSGQRAVGRGPRAVGRGARSSFLPFVRRAERLVHVRGKVLQLFDHQQVLNEVTWYLTAYRVDLSIDNGDNFGKRETNVT